VGSTTFVGAEVSNFEGRTYDELMADALDLIPRILHWTPLEREEFDALNAEMEKRIPESGNKEKETDGTRTR
jgi:hypothetical protein